MVVVPGPSPVVTGFGDAVIVAAVAAGLAADGFASGLFDGPHAAKKNNGRTIAIVRMNRFIKILCLWCFSNTKLLSSRVAKPACKTLSSETDPKSAPHVVAGLIIAACWSVIANVRRSARPIAPPHPRSRERDAD